jgi:very-short-patch-repair endonuclease
MNKQTLEEKRFEKWLLVMEISFDYNSQFGYQDNSGEIRQFYVDFILKLSNQKIVVFIDGEGHTRTRQKTKDDFQDSYLKNLNYKVIRISNYEINNENPLNILNKIIHGQ